MRDYDKRPIVIKDYNSIFMFIEFLPTTIICFIASFFHSNKIILIFLVSQAFYFYIRPYLFYGRKRIIKMSNEKIEFLQNNEPIETINLNEKFEIYKTYDDYYHKSQNLSDFLLKIA